MIRPYTAEEEQRIAAELDKPLELCEVKSRQGNGNITLNYLEGWRATELANSIFGFNGWSCEIKSVVQDYLIESESSRIPGRRVYSAAYTCTIRVTLRDGAFQEEVGTGAADELPSRSRAIDTAKKGAVTDARKRALREFGRRLGNDLSDPTFMSRLRKRSAPGTASTSAITTIKKENEPSNSAITTAIPTDTSSSAISHCAEDDYDFSSFDYCDLS